MRALFLLPLLALTACTDEAPNAVPASGSADAAEGPIARPASGNAGPPGERTTIVPGSTGVVAPDGHVLANAKRLALPGGHAQVGLDGSSPHRYLVAVQSGQTLVADVDGGATLSVYDPGGKPLAKSERAWRGTIDQTGDFVIEATGAGALRIRLE